MKEINRRLGQREIGEGWPTSEVTFKTSSVE